MLEHADVFDVTADEPTALCRRARLAAHDQHASKTFLERLYALRYCGRRDAQYTGGALETTFAHDCGHGCQRCIIASGLWFTSLGLGARLLAPLFARPAAWRVLDP